MEDQRENLLHELKETFKRVFFIGEDEETKKLKESLKQGIVTGTIRGIIMGTTAYFLGGDPATEFLSEFLEDVLSFTTISVLAEIGGRTFCHILKSIEERHKQINEEAAKEIERALKGGNNDDKIVIE